MFALSIWIYRQHLIAPMPKVENVPAALGNRTLRREVMLGDLQAESGLSWQNFLVRKSDQGNSVPSDMA
jgi:hypothetical protein